MRHVRGGEERSRPLGGGRGRGPPFETKTGRHEGDPFCIVDCGAEITSPAYALAMATTLNNLEDGGAILWQP